jgi:uncharacterized membrane protein (DUF485 family)
MPKPEDGPEISDWDVVANNEEFKDLMAAKARFIVPVTLFFVVYYFALPVLVGYAPKLMSRPVDRTGEHRLPLRALAIFHGVVYRVALCEGGRKV